MYKLLSVLLLILVAPWQQARGQCLSYIDTLYFEDFEGVLPGDWEFNSSNDEAPWLLGETGFGRFKNPGTSQWIYVDDQADNKVGTASITTGIFDLSKHKSMAELSFFVNFQEFDKHGSFRVEMYNGEDWFIIYETKEDIEGKVIIDIHELVDEVNQFRLTYDDEGAWGWGLGIDNFLISGSATVCGNGVCDPGENPGTCKEDCPVQSELPKTWIAKDTDITSNPVQYKSFTGNGSCDDCSQEIDLGFDFLFYGKAYQSIHINSNGNISLGKNFVKYIPQSFCLDGPAMIAPFFSDVDLSKGGRITYYLDSEHHYIIINWEGVAYFGCEKPCELNNSYQLILTDGSIGRLGESLIASSANVIINYGDMQWTGGTASGAVQGFGGSPATVGLNAGEENICIDYGVFSTSGYSFWGNSSQELCPPNGVDHLDNRSLFFNTIKGELAEPTGISSLEGSYSAAGVALRWTVDCIKEGGYFEIERVGDSGEYELISLQVISDEQFKNGISDYVFVDTIERAATLDYRIKYQGALGTEHTDSVRIHLESIVDEKPITEDFEIVSYGPNPLQDYLTISLQAKIPQKAVYQLLDMNANLYASGEIMLENSEQPIKIPTANLPAGNYVLSIRSPFGKQFIHLSKN